MDQESPKTTTSPEPTAAPNPAQTAAPAPAPEAKKGFFATLPGIITAAVGGLTALTGLITALNAAPWLQPKPTPTVRPTPTPVATATSVLAAGGLLVDDFADSGSGWETARNDDYALSYSDGQYRVQVVTTEYDVWGAPLAQHQFSDFSLEVEAQQVAGPDEAIYGVMVRYSEGDNFYLFAICSQQSYIVERSDAGEYEVLVRWSDSEAILPAGEVNRLRVDCLGAAMRFYVNDVELCELTDITYSSGGIGLLASTFEGDALDVRFDNLQVRPLLRFK